MIRASNSYLKMKNYFEDLASKSVHVKSFAGYFQRELVALDSGDQLQSPYLAVFDYQLGLSGPEQNTISVRKIKFAIMYKNLPEDNLAAQYLAIDNAEAIILKFLSRIKMDSYKEDHFLYQAFRKENSKITPVELSINSFGAEVSLEFQNNQTLGVKQEDWTDTYTTC